MLRKKPELLSQGVVSIVGSSEVTLKRNAPGQGRRRVTARFGVHRASRAHVVGATVLTAEAVVAARLAVKRDELASCADALREVLAECKAVGERL